MNLMLKINSKGVSVAHLANRESSDNEEVFLIGIFFSEFWVSLFELGLGSL